MGWTGVENQRWHSSSPAGHTNYQVISLDNYLDKNKGTYVEHIDLEGVRDAVREQKGIVEGICLLSVMERADLKLDLSIYVQRYHHGYWADRDWLGLDQDIEDYLKKLDVSAKFFSGVKQPEQEDNLSTEIIRYHHEFHPHERADLIYSWNDS